MADDRLLAWREGQLVEIGGEDAAPASALLVADSWLVEDGLVRGLDIHRERFAAGCRAQAGVPADTVADLFAAAAHVTPRRGRWFPRVESRPSGLWYRLRQAPPPSAPTARLWVAERPDPRRCPRIKGPDLDALASLREEARSRGADEALLSDDRGHVLEGALSGLVWWRGDHLCLPSDDLPVLRSVTVALLVGLAGGARRERCQVGDLAGLEVWMVSALQGIRAVTSWAGGGPSPGPALRAHEWGSRLRALHRSL